VILGPSILRLTALLSLFVLVVAAAADLNSLLEYFQERKPKLIAEPKLNQREKKPTDFKRFQMSRSISSNLVTQTTRTKTHKTNPAQL